MGDHLEQTNRNQKMSVTNLGFQIAFLISLILIFTASIIYVIIGIVIPLFILVVIPALLPLFPPFCLTLLSTLLMNPKRLFTNVAVWIIPINTILSTVIFLPYSKFLIFDVPSGNLIEDPAPLFILIPIGLILCIAYMQQLLSISSQIRKRSSKSSADNETVKIEYCD